MKAILNILSLIVTILVGLLFAITISISPILLATSTIVTNRTSVKSIINDSDLSQVISDQIVQQALTQLTESGVPNKTVNSLKPNIDKLITPDYIQKNVNSIIDGTYDWLENKSETIKVDTTSLDLNSKLSKLIPKEYLKNEGIIKGLEALKPCTLEQAKKLEKATKLESLKGLCLPPSLDITKLIGSGYNENIDQKEIQINSLFAVPNTTTEYANLIKTAFTLLSYLYLILLSISLLLASIFVFLPPWQLAKAYTLTIFTTLVGGISYIIFKSTDIISKIINFLISQGDIKSNDIPLEVIQNIVNTLLLKIWEQSALYSLYIFYIGIFLTIVTVIINLVIVKRKPT